MGLVDDNNHYTICTFDILSDDPDISSASSFQTMSKMQRHQQEALWEFVYTELTFINKLLIIKDVRCHSLAAYSKLH